MRSLTPEEIWQLFDGESTWPALTTIGPDGFPHTVAIGCFRLGEVIYCGCRDGTRKIRNIEGNRKISIMVESGRGRELRGVMFQGDATVVRDPQERLEIKRELCRSLGQPEPTRVPPGMAYIRLDLKKTLSWGR